MDRHMLVWLAHALMHLIQTTLRRLVLLVKLDYLNAVIVKKDMPVGQILY